MTVLVYSHAACMRHAPGPEHPERPARLQAVMDALQRLDPAMLDWREAPKADRAQLERVHTKAHVDHVFAAEPTQGLQDLDPDTLMSPGSLDAALYAAGAGCAAVDAILGGDARRAFCAVRPPGHHATAEAAMGFCLFNNIAVAAAHALDVHGLTRVAIADFDVHHGNGSEAIFADEPRVLYASSHQMPLYPGTGDPVDNRATIRNAALPASSGSEAFRAAWENELLPAMDAFAPQLVLVSAGFDADRRDPLAQVSLAADDFAWISRRLCELADRHAGGRLLSMLEGGYALAALEEGVTTHLEALSAA